MTIRHPADRIRSYIDYIGARYEDKKFMNAHPDRVQEVTACACDDINTVPQKIYGKEFPTGKPIQNSQKSYATRGVVCLKLDEIPEALQILLKLKKIPDLPHVNKSKNKSDAIGPPAIHWLNQQKHYRDDLQLWNKWTRAD